MGPEGWLGKLGDRPLDDAILVRIRNSSYTILLKGRSLQAVEYLFDFSLPILSLPGIFYL